MALRNLTLGLLSTYLSAKSSVNILLSYCALQTIHKMLLCEDEIHLSSGFFMEIKVAMEKA